MFNKENVIVKIVVLLISTVKIMILKINMIVQNKFYKIITIL